MNLSRLWQLYGNGDQPWQVLAESYSWLTEGFETHNLHEAKALWQALH